MLFFSSNVSDQSLVDGIVIDEHGSPDFQRMISVITQQSEVTNEENTAGQKEEPEMKITDDGTMELGRVRFLLLV